MFKFIVLGILLSIAQFGFTQTKREKVPSYFGLQVKPILPTRFIGNPVLTQLDSGFHTTFSQRTGYSFGGVVRVGLTKLLALETGINLNQRNFDIEMSVPDSNVYATNDLSFVTYDIPINALVYIKLDEKWYMNTTIGTAMSYNPTNVGVKTLPGGYHTFRHTGLAKKVIFELNAEVGFEFRTEKSGFFYLGGIGRVPFEPLFYLKSQYAYQGYKVTIDAENQGKVDGSYLAVTFKYFFPNIKNKGQQFQNGPITQ